MKLTSLTCILLCGVYAALAQPKQYASFRDYFVVNMNPDSLQEKIYAQKRDQTRYVHDLIWLEYSRYKVSDNFGNDLVTIQKMTSQQRFGIGAAMYNYLMGLRYKSEDAPKALVHFQKALTYFDRTKDTSGLAHCHLALMRLNIDNYNERIGDSKEAKFHYDRVVTLVQQSTDKRNEISLLPRYLTEHDLFYKEMSLSDLAKEYLRIINLIKQYPEMRFMLKDIYLNLSFFYLVNKDYKTAIEKLKLSLYNSSHCSEYNQITIYSNLASASEGLGDYIATEKYLRKILSARSSTVHFNDYVYIDANYGMAIASIKNKKFEQVIPYITAYDSLGRAYTERLKVQDLLKLQTKYESEKKEATINMLKKEQLRTDHRNQLILAGLLVALVIIGVIGVLVVRLRKTNAELQSLQSSRDKLYTVIAHDLREPINSLMSVGTLLRHLIRTNQTQEVEKVTQQIDRMGQQTSLLLNNLLEWGKSNYFEEPSPAQQIDATPLLHELAQVYQALADAKSIAMTVALPAAFPLVVNPKDLSLIVRNLLDNALKYAPGGGHVALTATAPLADTGQATIQVRNSGDGIDPAKLVYLQRVFAGKLTPQVGTQGLGLGLVLISDFARKNEATLLVSSRQAEETTFSLLIPCSLSVSR
ncbi:tetratricopeptide repeat-containing sensor histidine kinase [Fibrella aquatica]|uniref:tetratricopeptide repeat-containing sensor histidine kinase n=1 Tax=Fibrella aquatica TaxID=3242487 RepID=UPI0035200A2E